MLRSAVANHTFAAANKSFWRECVLLRCDGLSLRSFFHRFLYHTRQKFAVRRIGPHPSQNLNKSWFSCLQLGILSLALVF